MFEGAARKTMEGERSFGDAEMVAAAPAPALAARQRRPELSQAMAASVESAATGQAMGELFQYNVSAPVTVGRGQSAMVPIVSTELAFKKDLIYNGAKMPTHPVATIRFKNSTGLTLERGPVTVLENGEYVGEAVLPFTADKAEAVISYAVELGIHIKENLKTETQLHSLQIKDGYLLQNQYDIRRTTYRVDNRTPQAKTILIERNATGPYTVFNTPKPVEKTLEAQRYRVRARSGNITEFILKERRLLARREELKNLSYQGLQRYFEGKFLNRRTYTDLKALLDVWAEIGRLETHIAEQEQQREKIYKAQEQAQKNMSVLAASGEEGRLRARYVQQLTDSEEQLAEIDQIVTRTQAQIKQQQAEVEKMIAALGSS
jgi:hypothetical protein